MIIAEEAELIDGLLKFANLPEIESTRQVESIFDNHPYTRTLIPKFSYFKRIPNPNDTDGFIDLQDTARLWLTTLITGRYSQQREVLNGAIRAFKLDSSETAIIQPTLMDQAGEQIPAEIRLPLWGLPELSFDKTLNLRLTSRPFIAGVHGAVSYAVILLFARGLKDLLAICPATKEGRTCGNFYLKTKKLRIACSKECKRRLRIKQIYGYVKEIRQNQRLAKRKKNSRTVDRKELRRRQKARRLMGKTRKRGNFT